MSLARPSWILSLLFFAAICSGAEVHAELDDTERERAPAEDYLVSVDEQVVFFPPVARYGVVYPEGRVEVRPDQLELVRGYLEQAIEKAFETAGARLVKAVAADEDAATLEQLTLLHPLVSSAMASHGLGYHRITTKSSITDYSLGPNVSMFQIEKPARFGLFAMLVGSELSGEVMTRMVAGTIIGGAILGPTAGMVVLPTGGQDVIDLALVDMTTGDYRWRKRRGLTVRTKDPKSIEKAVAKMIGFDDEHSMFEIVEEIEEAIDE